MMTRPTALSLVLTLGTASLQPLFGQVTFQPDTLDLRRALAATTPVHVVTYVTNTRDTPIVRIRLLVPSPLHLPMVGWYTLDPVTGDSIPDDSTRFSFGERSVDWTNPGWSAGRHLVGFMVLGTREPRPGTYRFAATITWADSIKQHWADSTAPSIILLEAGMSGQSQAVLGIGVLVLLGAAGLLSWRKRAGG